MHNQAVFCAPKSFAKYARHARDLWTALERLHLRSFAYWQTHSAEMAATSLKTKRAAPTH